MIQSAEGAPSGWMGPPFSALRSRRAAKSGRTKLPAAAKFPLTGGKNHGKIRRLYDGEGYSAIFIIEITIAYFPEQCKSGLQEF